MKARRWAPIIFGVAVFVVFLALGMAVVSISWMREHMAIDAVTAEAAESAFDEVRERYRDKVPLLEMDGTVVSRRNPPANDTPRTSLTTLHVLAWDSREEQLARFELPFWLVRLKEAPIRFGTYATGLDDLRVSLTAGDIERYGPGIIIDVQRRGERAMIWVE
jgi:hypothetical protein